MSRRIPMYSRVRARGLAKGMPYQPSTTCGPETPRPRMNLPPDKWSIVIAAIVVREPTAMRAATLARGGRPPAPQPSGYDILSTDHGGGEMAVAVGVLSDTRRRALEALCDTFAPSLSVDDEREAVRDFYARSASDLGIAAQIEGLLAQTAMPEEIEALGQLLDAFAAQDIEGLPPAARTELVHGIAASSPEAKLGVRQLRAMTFLFFYGLPDEAGQNPNWEAIGYPGPLSPPPSPEQAPKTIAVERLGGESGTLQADACVIGSGAGGAVIAAELAAAGESVVVLEMGGYRNEADFK